jgi:hypothetical protein
LVDQEKEVKAPAPASKKGLYITGSIIVAMMALVGSGLGVYYGWYLPTHGTPSV